MPGPMHGVRVVDLTQMISGPLGAMILADQGADVIKVEPPTGDNTRSVATDARRHDGELSSTTTATSARWCWTSSGLAGARRCCG